MIDNKRGAGILLHITSLPSMFGIGDVGPAAKQFAEFVYRSGQKYWQILPLNPTEGGQAHSPYSSISSRAGNTLLISPEMLAEEGLLDASMLHTYHQPQEGKTVFEPAERAKKALFDMAWTSFRTGKFKQLQQDFDKFCAAEAYWMRDVCLYMLLKQLNNGKPWYEWEEKYKLRDEDALAALVTKGREELNKIAFFQFMFFRQWHELKDYCNKLNIQLFGDLPFYVSYDSVDVWAHKELFNMDDEGNTLGMAGVPPDAFSEDGQLWGMPVFRWDVLKAQGYSWWIERIKKNMELYDVLRLDHFRAFADYWEVPAGEDTAKNGEWKPGPGAELFEVINKELGDLPFIAEDLGEINDAVYELRDRFNFPGMKVLQFAFGGDMPHSTYIPHNYTENFVVYTGTHDNNTIRGWYRQQGKDHHAQLEQYIGKPLTEDDIHIAMSRLAYASVANIAILPMQDILGLDEIAKMNTPASQTQNWLWRLLPNQIPQEVETRLKEWVELYNRK